MPRPKPHIKKAKAAASANSTSREKVRAHRARMRGRGMRLMQMWLPDTRTEAYAKQAHEDSLAIARSEAEAEEQAWLDSMSWWNSEEARALEAREPDTPWWREPSDK
jgi:hypothetical protein